MGKTCYIIGPIDKPESLKRKWADFIMKEVIKPIVMECGYEAPQRSDKDLSQALIMIGVIQQMLDADLVFADLSYRNANAYYELGIRHCIQKPVIHLIKKKQSPPFDLKDHRVIFIDWDSKMIQEAQEAIKERIRAIETNPTQPYSYVQACMHGKEFDALSPEEKLYLAKYRVMEILRTYPNNP
jgi:nucleoside 2-deoxyribosyltransferase